MATNPSAIVEAIDAEILARVTGGSVQEYSIGGRSLRKMDLDKLKDLRSYYAELAGSSSGSSRNYAELERG